MLSIEIPVTPRQVDRHRPAGKRARAALLVAFASLLAVLPLALLASPASASTGAPELLAPVSSEVSTTPLHVKYRLPEAAETGTLKLIFIKGVSETVVTLSSGAGSVGEHSLVLNVHNLASSAEVVSATPNSLADGTYEVVLAYQNAKMDPPAIAEASEVVLRTVTATPMLSAPLTGAMIDAPFDITYTLPEAALSDSVELVFEGDVHGQQKIVLTNTAAGMHTIELNPFEPTKSVGVASGPASLPSDTYKLSVSYRDTLENPASESGFVTITLKRPSCSPGSYSATGETPCTPCPAGTNDPHSESTSVAACELDVPGSWSSPGASRATPCEPGTFAASSGSSECAPSPPGSYVESIGASSARPCPAGSYAPVASSLLCTETPAGTYASGGAVEPTPCPAGSESAAGASACMIGLGGSVFTGTTTGTVTPPVNVPAPLAVSISAAPRQVSLRRTHTQAYTVRCSATTTLTAHVSVVIRVAHRAVSVVAAARRVSCRAGASTKQLARFKLSKLARRLLGGRGAKLSVKIALYPTGGSGATKSVATKTVRGRA
jgi:hypothetical protein